MPTRNGAHIVLDAPHLESVNAALTVFAIQRTPMIMKIGWLCLGRLAEPFDFPFELDATRFLDPRAYSFAERFKVRSRSVALIDEKVAVQLGNFRVSYREATAACGIDKLP